MVLLIMIALAFAVPRIGLFRWNRTRGLLRRIGAHKWRSIAIAAAFPLCVRMLMLAWYPPPPPYIHDEFSYLLQGDTFAHGRVTNPTPPDWEHFETEYTLLEPNYVSQYQPAQGMVLALGQVVFGHPWWGVWLSMGLMFGSLCWALQFIVPPGWALAGALGAALQFGIFGIWMNSYFGGAIAAAAGALVLGSLARTRKMPQITASSGALAAAAIIVLFATRPFEALIWTAVVVSYAGYESVVLKRLKVWRRAVVPFSLVFVAGAVALAWYNWRITGSPLDPPYLAYRRIYGTPQPYWWQGPLHVEQFRFAELRNNYLNQLTLYNLRYSPLGLLQAEISRIWNFWRFFSGPFFLPAAAFAVFAARDRKIRPWLLISIPFILDKATYHAWFPAQNAPETALIVLVMLQGWRHLRVWRRSRRTGLAVSRLLIAGLCLTIVVGSAGRIMELSMPSPELTQLGRWWKILYAGPHERDNVITRLEALPGQHLVFVKYAKGHCFCDEWVFNSADLNSQRVIYARTYTPESDAALIRAFPKFDVWMVEPDIEPYRLTRLRGAAE
ncbi:MAG TPA: hypothetical protein VG273_06570 [Bryobacteraceae bacterium]|nr:hypothetical protein [Bryobacteraceae bacterium]